MVAVYVVSILPMIAVVKVKGHQRDLVLVLVTHPVVLHLHGRVSVVVVEGLLADHLDEEDPHLVGVPVSVVVVVDEAVVVGSHLSQVTNSTCSLLLMSLAN